MSFDNDYAKKVVTIRCLDHKSEGGSERKKAAAVLTLVESMIFEKSEIAAALLLDST